MKNYLIFVIFWACVSCQAGGENNLHVIGGTSSINACVIEYERASNKVISNDIDRVFILAYRNKYELIFAKGKSGIFEQRGEDYIPFLWCAVTFSETTKVYYLSDGMRDPFIDIGEVSQISDENPSGAWDMLFLKRSSVFEFDQKKLYAPDLYQF